jgi:hypothetical protein
LTGTDYERYDLTSDDTALGTDEETIAIDSWIIH